MGLPSEPVTSSGGAGCGFQRKDPSESCAGRTPESLGKVAAGRQSEPASEALEAAITGANRRTMGRWVSIRALSARKVAKVFRASLVWPAFH